MFQWYSCIACTVYNPGVSSTVHSYDSLRIADLLWGQLVEGSIAIALSLNMSKKANVLIWDEASSSSQRMLKLVNVIHHCLSDFHHNHPIGEGKSLEFL